MQLMSYREGGEPSFSRGWIWTYRILEQLLVVLVELDVALSLGDPRFEKVLIDERLSLALTPGCNTSNDMGYI